MAASIYIIVDHFEGKVRPVTFELAAFALDLKEIGNEEISFLLLGDDIENMADDIARKTGIKVAGLKIPSLMSYNQEIYVTAVSEYLSDRPFSYLLAAQTTQGMDFASVLAVKIQAAAITSVESMKLSGEKVSFRRSVFNGKAVADISPKSDKTILTILPGMMKPKEFDNSTPGGIDIQEMIITPLNIQNKELVRSRSESQTVADADIIISAGRGIGKEENLELIYRLAERFSKSAVGGSRPICDLGWLGYQQQIGITGLSVSPSLYLACGISGAIQHLSGIRGADFIVAVNTDPNAAIFNMADVCIVEDVLSFIPILIEALDNAAN